MGNLSFKNIITILLTCFISLISISQINEMTRFSSCATALEVCNKGTNVLLINNNDDITPDTPPNQYIYFLRDSSSYPTFSVNSQHTGSYQLFGPILGNNSKLQICNMISLGILSSSSGSINNINISSISNGVYMLVLQFDNYFLTNGKRTLDYTVGGRKIGCVRPVIDPCKDCLKKFSPPPGEYILSAWTKGDPSQINETYKTPKISIGFNGGGNNLCSPQGAIIDGWQKIDTVVTVPQGAQTMQLELKCTNGDCYFDDIRFYPLDGSMVTYVYDPINLRLMAQLDERNYATLYEYDEEGKLIRTKKETEKGIMTIQENRDNIKKP